MTTDPRRPCLDCGEPLAKLYPQADEGMAWGHLSLEDAELCPRDRGARTWPIPDGSF